MTAERTVLLVGLPESGKSTYLGALFHQLNIGPNGGLALARAPEQRDYLIELEAKWLALKPLERSVHHGPRAVSFPIRDIVSNAEVTLHVPDVNGEDYEQAWEHGVWDSALRASVEVADAMMLFVRADDIVVPAPLSIAAEKDVDDERPRGEWDLTASPTQAKLCDVLEQIDRIRHEDSMEMAVVISAWDTVHEVITPRSWLDWKAPLLAQWIAARAVFADVFAVSAQGGDVSNGSTRSRLARDADRRPVPEGAVPLTQPLKWLLDRIQQR